MSPARRTEGGTRRAAARARRGLVDRVRRLESLQKVTADLADAMTVDRVVAALLDGVADAVPDALACVLGVVRDGRMEIVDARGLPESARAARARTPLDDSTPLARAARTGQAIWLQSHAELVAAFPAAATSPAPRALLEVVAAVPIAASGEVFGALGVSYPKRRELDEVERAFLRALGQAGGQALQRARLFLDVRRAAGRLQILAEASQRFAEASFDVEQVARAVVASARAAVGAEASVFLASTDGATWTPGAETRPGAIAPPADVASRARMTDRRMEVPLVARDRLFGALVVVRPDDASPYAIDDRALLDDLAHRAAMALDAGRLFAEVAAAVRLRDDFLSIASHELKTPIATTLLHLDALNRLAPVDAKVRRHLDGATRSTARLVRLVEELLDVSRLQAGRLSLDREDLDLAALVRVVVERHAEGYGRAGVELRYEAGPGDARGRWDRARLELVLDNLLTNALKYGAGRPVDVRLTPRHDDVVIEVQDRGIGVPAEDQRRIFDKFERAVVGRKQAGGLGLGLWIAAQVVDAHGGTLAVTSVAGSGSTFRVVLPRLQ